MKHEGAGRQVPILLCVGWMAFLGRGLAARWFVTPSKRSPPSSKSGKSAGQDSMHYSCSSSESQIEPCQRTDCEKLERIRRGAGARRVLGILEGVEMEVA